MRGVRTDKETERKAIDLYLQGLSKLKVGQQLEISARRVYNILERNNEPRRSISEALTKYPKTDFGGEMIQLAGVIGFAEDCFVGFGGRQILVQTSTTHTAQIKLFIKRFGEYGHVNYTPGYNKRFSLYQWQLQILLKPQSFAFLLEYKENPMKFLAIINGNGTAHVYIASLTDAEGSVGKPSTRAIHGSIFP